MKKFLLSTFAVLSAFALSAAGKPAAIFGHPSDVSHLTKGFLKPVGIKFETPKKWLTPQEFNKYAVIYFGERNAGATFSPELAEYVKNGGVVIFTGSAPTGFTGKSRDLSAAQDFLGFSYIGNMGKVKVDKVVFNDSPDAAALKFSGKTFTWTVGYNAYPAKIRKSAKVISNAFSGKKTYPALLMNKFGKGEVWWINPMYFRFVSVQKNTGFADAEGRFVLTESGKNIEALKELYLAVFRRSSNLGSEEVKKSSWGTVPLGKPGNIKYDGTFKNKPVYRKAPELKPAFKVSENGKALAQIVIGDRKFRYKAAELKYHLDAITGAKFKVVNKRTAGMPAIIFEVGGKADQVLIKTGKDQIVLSGNTDLGVFYLLEKLGCRYLWPGKLGKVIPKQSELWIPDIQLDVTPKLMLRQIRAGGGRVSERGKLGMTRCGITDFKAVAVARSKASYDAAGNSGFFAWHGNGGRTPYSWGHAFGSYYTRLGKSNPDFFALQPDGTRSQAASPDRPRLCMSNPKLVKYVANELIARFKKNPSRQALSVCLNDGGRARFCMCEECRKLDPVNATPLKMGFTVKGVPISVNYVYLTDRVFTFSNRIAAEVNKVIPGKKVTVYVYSCYSAPPVAVKPAPNLVLFSTAMDYTTDKKHQRNLQTLASLSSFGNELFWRPNALRGFGSVVAPQNYARRMFEDTELLKANNARGMDFDCNEGFWSCKSLIYYTLSKAMWNPDRLSYDDIVDDYCRAGFGKSAELIKKYFTELEKVFDDAATREVDYCKSFTLEKIAELEQILDEAANTADDPVVKARVDFLKLGLEAGRFSTKLFNAKTGGDNKLFRSLQKEYRAFIQRLAIEEPLALSPGTIGFRTRFVAR